MFHANNHRSQLECGCQEVVSDPKELPFVNCHPAICSNRAMCHMLMDVCCDVLMMAPDFLIKSSFQDICIWDSIQRVK